MGHQHAADLALFAQVADELEDLILDGDVQRRGRLIGDDELGIPGGRWRSPPAGHATRRTGEDTAWMRTSGFQDPHRPPPISSRPWQKAASRDRSVLARMMGLHQLLLRR